MLLEEEEEHNSLEFIRRCFQAKNNFDFIKLGSAVAELVGKLDYPRSAQRTEMTHAHEG